MTSAFAKYIGIVLVRLHISATLEFPPKERVAPHRNVPEFTLGQNWYTSSGIINKRDHLARAHFEYKMTLVSSQ